MSGKSKIIYTETDEAPMVCVNWIFFNVYKIIRNISTLKLATYALLPVIQRFTKPMGIEVIKLFSKNTYYWK